MQAKLQILSALPTTDATSSLSASGYNLIGILASAVDVYVVGAGNVTLYVRGPVGWRKHPQGQNLSDNQSYHRLILGQLTSDAPRFICLLGDETAQASEAWLESVLY